MSYAPLTTPPPPPQPPAPQPPAPTPPQRANMCNSYTPRKGLKRRIQIKFMNIIALK